MDAKTLMASMGYPGYPAPLPLSRYAQLLGPCEQALVRAHCVTVDRVSMFLAQIGAESGSLRWTQELASGSDYDRFSNPSGPWQQLGNTEAGDGERFKGRSLIQITGRSHYAALSAWAHKLGYVPSADYFIVHPELLADDRYAFLGPVYYWTVARNMNYYADREDIVGGTYAVNGGYNNLSGRTARWNKCRSLGTALLPVATENEGAPTMIAYKSGGKFFLLQDGAAVQPVHRDFARNIAKMCGRPIGTVTEEMHRRIVANQHDAIASRGRKR